MTIRQKYLYLSSDFECRVTTRKRNRMYFTIDNFFDWIVVIVIAWMLIGSYSSAWWSTSLPWWVSLWACSEGIPEQRLRGRTSSACRTCPRDAERSCQRKQAPRAAPTCAPWPGLAPWRRKERNPDKTLRIHPSSSTRCILRAGELGAAQGMPWVGFCPAQTRPPSKSRRRTLKMDRQSVISRKSTLLVGLFVPSLTGMDPISEALPRMQFL